MKVKFKVKFMDWDKGDTATLKNEDADRYISVLGVCEKVTPPGKRKAKAAPENKMVKGAANK